MIIDIGIVPNFLFIVLSLCTMIALYTIYKLIGVFRSERTKMKLNLIGLMVLIHQKHVSVSIGFASFMTPVIQFVNNSSVFLWAGWTPFKVTKGNMTPEDVSQLPYMSFGVISTKMQLVDPSSLVYRKERSIKPWSDTDEYNDEYNSDNKDDDDDYGSKYF